MAPPSTTHTYGETCVPFVLSNCFVVMCVALCLRLVVLSSASGHLLPLLVELASLCSLVCACPHWQHCEWFRPSHTQVMSPREFSAVSEFVIRNGGTPPAVVASMASSVYAPKPGAPLECTICLEAFKARQTILTLQCKHAFHKVRVCVRVCVCVSVCCA